MNTSELIPILALIAALQAKHFICDGPLQTKAMVVSKGIYCDGMGLSHSAIHGCGTLVVLAASGFSTIVFAGLAVLDVLVHYHIDWTKENLVKWAKLTPQDAQFWWALSADQMLHQFTYLAIVYMALSR